MTLPYYVMKTLLSGVIDVSQLREKLDCIVQRPLGFPGVVLFDGDVAVEIFSSGIMLTSGARTMADAKSAVRRHVKNLREKGFNIRARRTIVNFIALRQPRICHFQRMATLEAKRRDKLSLV